MQQHKNYLRKIEVFQPIYSMVTDLNGDTIKVTDFWDTFDYTNIWRSKNHFVIDFKKYAPDTFIFTAVQKSGTFVKDNK